MENRIALVTGSNRGIGFATAKGLLQEGYTVVVTARSESDGIKAAKELSNFGEVVFHSLDISDGRSVENMLEFVETKFGRLDVLINNAGINYDTWHSAERADLQEVEQTINVNLFGAWRMSQAFLPMMRKHGYGRIVNVSSGAGALNGMSGGTPGYSISKAALNVLTIKLASNVQGSDILVNSVCPGWVRTDMGGSGAPRSQEQGAETILWAAQLGNAGPSGKFFRDKQEIDW